MGLDGGAGSGSLSLFLRAAHASSPDTTFSRFLACCDASKYWCGGASGVYGYAVGTPYELSRMDLFVFWNRNGVQRRRWRRREFYQCLRSTVGIQEVPFERQMAGQGNVCLGDPCLSNQGID